MIYCLSDIHGCYDKFVRMLDTIRFSQNDTLFILGDFADRGPDGIAVLIDCMSRNNVISLLGNHDMSARKYLPMLIQGKKPKNGSKNEEAYNLWMTGDGGDKTAGEFLKQKPEKQYAVLRYLESLLHYYQITVGGNTFFLSHTVSEKRKFNDLGSCKIRDFYLGEPEYEKEYCKDKFIVTGHTPTSFINPDMSGRILQMNRHIAIDCGAVFGKPLGRICLDSMQEFYIN